MNIVVLDSPVILCDWLLLIMLFFFKQYQAFTDNHLSGYFPGSSGATSRP